MISTLMFVVLSAILLATAWHGVHQKQTQTLKNKIYESRDTALREALRNARVATYYYFTLLNNDPINADFLKCMIGDDGAGSDCQAKDASGNSIPHQVKLTDDSNTPVIGEDSSHPVFYSLIGQVCPTPSDDCPFDVYASYAVTCDTGSSTCPQAYEIEMTVFVGVHPGFGDPQTRMALLKGHENISISNFKDSYHPILPPATPFGSPISVGAGPGGFITNQVYPPTTTTSTSTTSTTTTSTTTTLPHTVVPCDPGQSALPDGTCGSFNF